MQNIANTIEYAPEPLPAAGDQLPQSHGRRSLPALIWKRRRWLAEVTTIALVLGAIVIWLVPQRYESTAQLMPPDPQTFAGAGMLSLVTGGTATGTAGLANSILSGKTLSSQFVGILESRTVQDSLIDRFDLRKVYGEKYYLEARKCLAKHSDFSEDRKTGIVAIAVTDRDPARARDLAQAYIEELNKSVARVSTSSARRERIFLEDRLRLAEKELEEYSSRLSQFSSRNATLDPQAQARATLEGAARLQGELIAAESELRGLETIYSDNNTRVLALRARIGELRSQTQKLAGNRQEDGSELEEGQIYPSLRKLPLLGVTYADLYRHVKVQEAVYEVLMKQYELARVQEAKEIPTVSILDAPLMPEKKVFPPRTVFTLLAGCVAFVLALGWIILEQELQTRGVNRIGRLLQPEAWHKLVPGSQMDH